jgi:hypothetical protein
LIGHVFHRNCLLKHITDGKIKGGIEVKETQGGIRKQLLDDKEMIGYWKLITFYGELAMGL